MKNLSSPVALIQKSFGIFFDKKNLIYFIKVQSPLLPLAFISFSWSLVLAFAAEGLSESISTSPLFISFNTIIGILNSLVYLFVSIASIEAIRRVLKGSQPSIGEIYTFAKTRAWKYSLMLLLKGIILLFGFLLLIIPGVLFSVWFAFSGFEIVLNNSGVRESLSKSKDMVKGRFWPVLGRFLVFMGFAILVSIAISILPLGIGTLVTPLSGILLLLPTYLLYQELAGQER
jgi:hypothetical protein